MLQRGALRVCIVITTHLVTKYIPIWDHRIKGHGLDGHWVKKIFLCGATNGYIKRESLFLRKWNVEIQSKTTNTLFKRFYCLVSNPYLSSFLYTIHNGKRTHLRTYTPPPSKQILTYFQLTGATGFVGFATLNKALTSGYRVRISVRKSEQITTIQNHPLIAPFVAQDKLEFVIVPDITTDGAFDSALKDVTGILHIASPLPLPVRLSISKCWKNT